MLNYNGRLHFIDFLRGVAILLVLTIHISHFYTQILDLGKYGYLGVHVFFILIGFVLTLSMNDIYYKINYFFKFLLKRIVRLEIPYFLHYVLLYLFFILKKKTIIGLIFFIKFNQYCGCIKYEVDVGCFLDAGY
jgi:peptidoglycan/LPS O-acetylase OafA/YrhL